MKDTGAFADGEPTLGQESLRDLRGIDPVHQFDHGVFLTVQREFRTAGIFWLPGWHANRAARHHVPHWFRAGTSCFRAVE